MSRHENLGPKGFDRIQRLQTVEPVTVVDEQELVGEEELAQIDDASLGHIDDAIPARVSAADVQNLNFLAAEIERDPIPKRLIRESRFLLLRRHVLPLHRCKKIGAVVFVSNLPYVGVGNVAL